MRSIRIAAAASFVLISVSIRVSGALAQPSPVAREAESVDAAAPSLAQAEAGVALEAGAGAPLENDAGADAAAVDAATVEDAAAPMATDAESDAETAEQQADAPPRDVGFSVGLHIGYEVPFGRIKDVGVGDVVSGAVPFGIDIGYFFNPRLYAGVYVSYAYVTTSNNAASICPSDPNDSCSANLVRLGLASQWHFRPKAGIDPWAGLSLGYEILNISELDADGNSVTSAASHGFEIGAQGGVDFKPRSFYGLGPFVELSGGHYWGGDTAVFHGWIGGGLRLRTGL